MIELLVLSSWYTCQSHFVLANFSRVSSGLVDPSELLANIEMQINKIKDEAQSRKDIMDRIDRWLSACEEENWLEEYNLV